MFEDKTEKQKRGAESGVQPKRLERIEDLVSSEFLQAIAEQAEQFRFLPDYNLPPDRTGYTDIDTHTIYYNPLLIKGIPEIGLKPWSKKDVLGFCCHEAGHHIKQVLDYGSGMVRTLKELEIPEAYCGDLKAEQRFVMALRSHLQGALLDIWLESYMSRPPHFVVKDAIDEFQLGKGELKNYRAMPAPDQFLQFVLRSRRMGDEGFAQKLSEPVAEAYRKIQKSGALKAVMDLGAFLNPFASPGALKREIDRKVNAYQEYFLPEYLKLMEHEIEERKEKRRQMKGNDGDGRQRGGSSFTKSVPLTKEEEQELIAQILEELERAAKEWESKAPTEGEKRQTEELGKEIFELLEMRAQAEVGNENNPEQECLGPDLEGLEALSAMFERFLRESSRVRRRSLAEAIQVSPESVRTWEIIRERYQDEINSLSEQLADVFLEDRRWHREYMRREGEIVPGLEYETMAALFSGQPDPDTKFISVQVPEFLELEVEWIVDTSGSMTGEPIAESVALVVVVTEALKNVRESLVAEGLAEEEEQPLRVGATKFSAAPKRVSELNDPLTPEKELTMVHHLSMTGGGTTETESLEMVYKGMKLRADNVLKIMIMLSDGAGDRKGVWPIVRQVEQDDQVIFLVASLANTDKGRAIIETYAQALIKSPEETNVSVLVCQELQEILPAVAKFIRDQVEKRRRER